MSWRGQHDNTSEHTSGCPAFMRQMGETTSVYSKMRQKSRPDGKTGVELADERERKRENVTTPEGSGGFSLLFLKGALQLTQVLRQQLHLICASVLFGVKDIGADVINLMP